MTTLDQSTNPKMRRLPIWGFVVLVIVYLAAIQLIPQLTVPDGAQYGEFNTTEEITHGMWITVGIGSLIVLLVVAYLRWWRPVFIEDSQHRLPRWTWVFPIILLVAILTCTNWARLADQPASFIVALVIGAVFIGVSEEGMFRGIGVVTFRNIPVAEGWVAFWTCVVFGLAHSTNLFTEGPKAFGQVFATAAAGYFFYITRRATGGLLVPILLHGFWDMGLFTNSINKARARAEPRRGRVHLLRPRPAGHRSRHRTQGLAEEDRTSRRDLETL